MSRSDAWQPANMGRSTIAIPLLEEMLNLEKSGKRTTRIDIIVEVNLLSPQTRAQTIRQARLLIDEILANDGRPADKVSEGEPDWNDYVDQYLFASLTPTQIRELAAQNDRQKDKKTGRSTTPIYKIWPDFPVDFLLTESLATVKADASQVAFAANGKWINWAVIDSGIDGSHPHFVKHQNLELSDPLSHWDFSGDRPRPIRNANELIDLHGHGTHVAGIIAGELDSQFVGPDERAMTRNLDSYGQEETRFRSVAGIRGLAPECKIVSLNVADQFGGIKSSRIISALGYVLRVNGDGRLPRIHGVNISLGHGFDPEWFACGQSPLCIAVNQLVNSGTTVVVAAGNGGYGKVHTLYKGVIKSGLSNTLRDPANAAGAITVGATHRHKPHQYGVSYFSSKGPTGDGRMKPDLVAPGEKIISCASRQHDRGDFRYIEKSGTSMAAPHVSGCIAAFLSIRSEFKNQPQRVKEIFTRTATDLGRERYFQGHGLIDLMRAIQSV